MAWLRVRSCKPWPHVDIFYTSGKNNFQCQVLLKLAKLKNTKEIHFGDSHYTSCRVQNARDYGLFEVFDSFVGENKYFFCNPRNDTFTPNYINCTIHLICS